MTRVKKGEKAIRPKYVRKWTEEEDELLALLNEKWTTMLDMMRRFKTGADEIQYRMFQLGIKRNKKPLLQDIMEKHNKKIREKEFEERHKTFRDALPSSDKVLEEARKIHEEYKLNKIEKVSNVSNRAEGFCFPKKHRTIAFSQSCCAGRCCKRKTICQHYESWIEHGGKNARIVFKNISSSDCIVNYQFKYFVPMPGKTEDDIPQAAEVF